VGYLEKEDMLQDIFNWQALCIKNNLADCLLGLLFEHQHGGSTFL
jgi:hypothetical protein